MSIITATNLKTYCDAVAACWRLPRNQLGTTAGSAVAGTVREAINRLFSLVVTTLDDYEQQQDLSANANRALLVGNLETMAGTATSGLISALNTHCGDRGPSLDSSISDLASYLTYLNSTPFTALLTPEMRDAVYQALRTYPPAAGVMSPYIGPANGQASGLGVRAVGGAFTDGAAVAFANYAEVQPLLVVTADFVGGTAAPTFTVTGTDNTGATLNWTGTGASNNPATALATTLAAAVTAVGRATVALASTAGVNVGSLLTVRAGTANEETVFVEAVAGGSITAVFGKTHPNGAAVTGNTTVALTPATAGRRLRDATDLTIGVTGHTAGTVRIDGVQDRVAW